MPGIEERTDQEGFSVVVGDVRFAQRRMESVYAGLRSDWKHHYSGRLLIARAHLSGEAHRRNQTGESEE